MIEELGEYLIRHGWAERVADDIHDAYAEAAGAVAERAAVMRVALWMDDYEHEYSREVCDRVRRWQYEVGEKVWPYTPGDAVIVGHDTPEVLRAASAKRRPADNFMERHPYLTVLWFCVLGLIILWGVRVVLSI